jgi:hypothetical protein
MAASTIATTCWLGTRLASCPPILRLVSPQSPCNSFFIVAEAFFDGTWRPNTGGSGRGRGSLEEVNRALVKFAYNNEQGGGTRLTSGIRWSGSPE